MRTNSCPAKSIILIPKVNYYNDTTPVMGVPSVSVDLLP